MQDLAVVQAVLNNVIAKAVAERAPHITDLFLVVGELSGYADEAIRTYLDQISRGTIAEGANVHVRQVAAELQCMACFTKYHPAREEIVCPSCGSSGAKILAGEEFYMEASYGE
jgi:hydrogenase nickel incorporation protein HypA/HybF